MPLTGLIALGVFSVWCGLCLYLCLCIWVSCLYLCICLCFCVWLFCLSVLSGLIQMLHSVSVSGKLFFSGCLIWSGCSTLGLCLCLCVCLFFQSGPDASLCVCVWSLSLCLVVLSGPDAPLWAVTEWIEATVRLPA